MKALVFEAPDKPVVTDVDMPSITDNEVMVRTRTVGICHSDYELLAGRYIIPISYPVTPGHEWCGEIIEVGKAVKDFKPGDRVVGECVVRTPERLHHFGFSMHGADREFFNVNPQWLHKLPDAVDDKRGALIEPFTCGFYAVLRSGGTNASETVVVSGGGTIGLVSAAAAIGMGARVIVVDPIPTRREIALKLGADAAVDPSDGGAPERIRELTGGKGADLVVEASGHDASLAAVLDFVREEGPHLDGRHQYRPQDPGRARPAADEECHRQGLHRLARRVAGRGAFPRTHRARPVADPDPRFPADAGRRGLRARTGPDALHQDHPDHRGGGNGMIRAAAGGRWRT